MTTTAIEPRNGNGIAVPSPSRIGQATLVEQSRAVAEVEAAIVVAQRNPRNVQNAIAEMRESCRRKELADRAFYRYKQGNTVVSDATIVLARELARIWGNIQWGLREMRRDDEASEMLAFAWDVQTNARCDDVVINPHRRYTGGQELTDLRDISNNNTSVGSRRVRQAIFGVLPSWFVEEAKDLCAKTISDGGGVPLAQRVANAIEVFGNLGVTVPQLEAKIGQPSAKWADHDVAQLRIIRQSLLRGEISKDEEFPAASALVQAADLAPKAGAAVEGPAAPPDTPGPAVPDGTPGSGPAAGPGDKTPEPPGSRQQPPQGARQAEQGNGGSGDTKPKSGPLPKSVLGNLRNALKGLDFEQPGDDLALVSGLVGREITMLEALRRPEAEGLIKRIDKALSDVEGDPIGAAGALWSEARMAEAQRQANA